MIEVRLDFSTIAVIMTAGEGALNHRLVGDLRRAGVPVTTTPSGWLEGVETGELTSFNEPLQGQRVLQWRTDEEVAERDRREKR